MTTTTTAPPRAPVDIPFSVQGYVIDPKLVGYQILTNYESMYWRALVGNEAWSLYEILRSFCHQGNATCHPSIQLLTTILGLKEKRVLTGWAKTVGGKAYRYPGLIEILQEHQLIIAEVQGDGAQIHYLFHVNLTPGLLTDKQLVSLPALLQKKHAELVERCQQEQQALEAKRRPSKFKYSNENSSSDNARGGGNLPGGAVIYQGRGGNLPPEQQPYNNTHITNRRVREDQGNNNSGGTATIKTVVVAFPSQNLASTKTNGVYEHQTETIDLLGLTTRQESVEILHARADDPENSLSAAQQAKAATLIALGLAEKVAQRLAARYSQIRIDEKLEFLAFLQETQPEKVQNPRGWLRRAIEENYGPPDGFVAHAERERLAAEQMRIQQEEFVQAQADEVARQQEQIEQVSKAQAYRAWLNQTYGITQLTLDFWRRALVELEFAFALHQDVFQRYLQKAEILQVTEEVVRLGFSNEYLVNHLTHPGTKKLIERTISSVAGRTVQVCYEVIPEPELIDNS